MDSLEPQEPFLRQLRSDEAEALQSFYDGLAEESKRLFRPLGMSPSLANYTKVCEDGTRGLRHDLVLEADGRIVGWAFIQGLDSSAPTLGIGITEPYTGRGRGKRLMEALIQRARELSKEAIDLCHVVGNERARRLYHGFGFIVTGHFRGQDDLDYVRMRLTL